MTRKRTKKIPAYLGDSKQFMPLTYELQKSAAYRALSARQRDLYHLAYREAHYSPRHPRNDFPDVDDLKEDNVCYLTFGVAVSNRLYEKTGRTKFIYDRQILVKLGFLEIMTQGGNGAKNKTIYRLSGKWQQIK